MVSKAALRDELLAHLRVDLDALVRAHRATTEGATHEEAKPENDKDTRALELSYLARGQAGRIEELRAAIAQVAAMPLELTGGRVAVGAKVTVEQDDREASWLLAPAGGGVRLDAGQVLVVTPSAPVGRALVGREVGEEVEVVVGGKVRGMRIVRVV